MELTSLLVFLNILLSALVVASPFDNGKISGTPAVTPDYRLPLDIFPSSYNLTLRPYLKAADGLKQFTFDGEAYITIATRKTLNAIIMHSKNLNYTKMEYWDNDLPSRKFPIVSSSIDLLTDKFSLNLSSSLTADTSYTLHFVYVGQMNDDMHGFYRSSYVDDTNNVKWLGSTQFETIHARRAFPCFDEPKFKATFALTLIRDKRFKTVSNTRLLISTKLDNVMYADIYDRTSPMSTYILAFLVSDFNERGNGNFSVIARPEYYSQTSYGFEVGQKLIKEFDNYFMLPYYNLGIDKMHLAAIPDFSAGAMENWGLLTFRERYLLYQEGSTTFSDKQRITDTISHEQAHMWFGDLVTCEWWSYTWLNEGFATYFQYMMTAAVYPEWEYEKKYVVSELQLVFELDSTSQANPMTDTTAVSPIDLSIMFNGISYKKGGSIIRMVRHAMTENSFQKALREYLNEFKYKNAVPDNLLKHWQNNWPTASKVHAEKVFRSFTEQVGYPVITVNVSSDGRRMQISQKRFLLKANDGSNSSLLYTVPFTYTTSKEMNFNSTEPKFYLEAKTGLTELNLEKVNWVIANIQETGYYRVNYNIRNWHNIHHALMGKNWGGIHELNRAQIVDDLLNLARSGEIDYDLTLSCLEYLQTETNYLPWTAAFSGYDYLAIRLGTSHKQNFANYILQQTEKAFKMLGFSEKESDTPLDVLTRNDVLSWSCKWGNQECISEAFRIFNAAKITPVPANIRAAIYCTALREGSDEQFDFLYNKFKTETVPTEQTLIIKCLGCVKDVKLVEKYFNIILSDDIRLQDKHAALLALYTQNEGNVSPVFKLVTDNCDKLAKSMGTYSSVASTIFGIANLFTTEQQKKDLEHFNKDNKHKFGDSAAVLENAVNTVEENLFWSSTHMNGFVRYLQKYSSSAANPANVLNLLYILLAALISLALVN